MKISGDAGDDRRHRLRRHRTATEITDIALMRQGNAVTASSAGQPPTRAHRLTRTVATALTAS
ncbi:hypothetical protein GCM10020218_049950 [Dactylosporangium vinaceum]